MISCVKSSLNKIDLINFDKENLLIFTFRINSGSWSTTKLARRRSSVRFESVVFLKSGWLNNESASEFRRLFYWKKKEKLISVERKINIEP